MLTDFLGFDDYEQEILEFRTLFCPFTWENRNLQRHGGDTIICMPMDLARAEETRDALVTAASPWHRVVEQVAIAYSYGTHKKPKECLSVLADCYMPLLPFSFFRTGCALIEEYREALRHLLDASVACQKWDVDRPDPLLSAHIKTITPFQRLGSKQQAALYAVQARLSRGQGPTEGALRRSVVLNPYEGAWHTMLGEELVDAEQRVEGVSRLREGYRQRRTVHSTMALASALSGDGSKQGWRSESETLLAEALAAHPNHPHALYEAARMLPGLRGKTAESYKEARELLRRAIRVTGDRAVYQQELGRLFKLQGRTADAKRHWRKACRLVPLSAPVLQHLYQLGPDSAIRDSDTTCPNGPKVINFDSCNPS